MDKLVSVVMPTYGDASKLNKTIDSVINQTYSSVELIIVDDNGIGTEQQLYTSKIIENYINKGYDINYICHKKNKNGSAARNTGIKAAKGSYIALLDDDDIFRPEKLNLQVKALDSITAEHKVCYAFFNIHFPDGRVKEVKQTNVQDISLEMLKQTIEIPSSTLMFSKSAWEAIDGFDESFNRHQDWEFLVRLGQIGTFTIVDKVCMNRIIVRRNSPPNPLIAEEYRYHFLGKMKEIIEKYPKKEQREIIYFHEFDIGYKYIKRKNIKQGLKHYLKSKGFIRCIIDTFIRTVNYVKDKN